jgi:hypothetical protein
MTSVNSYFSDFLVGIRPTPAQILDYKQGHTKLRERLMADEKLRPNIVSTFLQGSYKRSTAVRPKGDSRSDVDVIVVTKLHPNEFTPQKAMDYFSDFLDEHYTGKWEQQGRSMGIKLSKVELDLVVTSAPQEAEEGILLSKKVTAFEGIGELFGSDPSFEGVSKTATDLEEERRNVQAIFKDAAWRLSPLQIPDREAGSWEDTHPLAQIDWTIQKNAATDGYYVNVVKALKWWKKVKHAEPKYPKGYPIEHLIGQCCPDGINSVAQGVTETLEEIRDRYAEEVSRGKKPEFPDHGVDQDVFARVSEEDFASFHEQASEAATVAREALEAETLRDSVEAWHELFGDKFPKPPPGDNGSGGLSKGPSGSQGTTTGGFTRRQETSRIGGGRWG